MNRSQTLTTALHAEHSETRLRAALDAGTGPEPGMLEVLIDRCGTEPDFYVRDMLTWAIARYPVDETIPAVIAELGSATPQARSQALHTLSKIGDDSAWPAISRELLTDADYETARCAWRAAVALVPEQEVTALAAILATQFGRGDADMYRSLSRAFVALGDAAEPVVAHAQRSADPGVRGHAAATEQLMADPESAFVYGR
ncbi:HEAT repeat domain-containing protein [Gordonia sp. (in: high G+C Gram-positive bacteria)]|uniref:HEAT repeat domain-containing protein n=1 Tax=Gordonia sp. (in: high G+C Gram-positive bacteria) TaxID=84139 RepID=UPI003F9DF708